MDPDSPGMLDFLGDLLHDALSVYTAYPNFVGVQLDDHFACPAYFGTRCSEAVMTAAARAVASKLAQYSRYLLLAPATLSFARASLNVDWQSWMQAGLFSEVVPQLYTANAADFKADLDTNLDAFSDTSRFRAGVRVNGTGASTPWASVIEQLVYAASKGVGVAIW
jgi:uncharacterized lipoprotein YddW (UPF0748 family)